MSPPIPPVCPSSPLTLQRLVSAKPSPRSMSVPSDLHRGRPPELAARILCAAISGLPTPPIPGGTKQAWPLRQRSSLQGLWHHHEEPAWGREKPQHIRKGSRCHHVTHTPTMLSPSTCQHCNANTGEHPHVLLRASGKITWVLLKSTALSTNHQRLWTVRTAWSCMTLLAVHHPVQSIPLAFNSYLGDTLLPGS